MEIFHCSGPMCLKEHFLLFVIKLEDLKASHTLGGVGEGDTSGEGRGEKTRGLRVYVLVES